MVHFLVISMEQSTQSTSRLESTRDSELESTNNVEIILLHPYE